MRADLVIDMTGAPGDRFRVTDTFYQGLEYRLLDLAYAAAPLREHVPGTPVALPANPLAEPDLASAERHSVSFGGGMMSGMMGSGSGGMMGGGMMGGGMLGGMGRMMQGMQHGRIWTVNGVAATGHVVDTMLTHQHGRSCVLALANDPAWPHPIPLTRPPQIGNATLR